MQGYKFSCSWWKMETATKPPIKVLCQKKAKKKFIKEIKLCILPVLLTSSRTWLWISITLLTLLEPVCAAPSTTSIHSKTSFISKGISFLLPTSAISGSDDDAEKFLHLIQATQMQLSTKYKIFKGRSWSRKMRKSSPEHSKHFGKRWSSCSDSHLLLAS